MFLVCSRDEELVVESKYPPVIGGCLNSDMSLDKEDENQSGIEESI
jgi:hypothetical protein